MKNTGIMRDVKDLELKVKALEKIYNESYENWKKAEKELNQEIEKQRMLYLDEVKGKELKGTETFILKDHIYRNFLKGMKAIELFNIGMCVKCSGDGCMTLPYDRFYLVKDERMLDKIYGLEYKADDKRG